MTQNETFFVKSLLKWFKKNKRIFPWRETGTSPYNILVAELMLKKTRANNVVEVYNIFINKYPDVESINSANSKDLNAVLKPLGLIKQRVKTFKNVFKIINKYYNNKIPNRLDNLLKIKGIGIYTANAVLCFGYNKDVPIVDVNITRVCKRYFGVEAYGDPRVDLHIWELLRELMPKHKCKDFNWALLDFASIICKSNNPNHEACPLKECCSYYLFNIQF
jgi:A/G-specific adenine glycosylase